MEGHSTSTQNPCTSPAAKSGPGSGEIAVGSRSYLRSRSPALFPLKDFCNSETSNRFSPNPRPVEAERVSGYPGLQDDEPQDPSRAAPNPSMDGYLGHQGCLHPSSYQEEPPQVPGPDMLGKVVLLQSTALRVSSSSLDIYNFDGTGARGTQKRGYPDTGLYRRSCVMGKGQGRASPTSLQNLVSTGGTRSNSEHAEIVTFANLLTNVAGGGLGFTGRNLGSFTKTYRGNSKDSTKTTLEPSRLKKGVGAINRQSSLYKPNKQKSKTPFAWTIQTRSVRRSLMQRYSSENSTPSEERASKLDPCRDMAKARKLLTSSTRSPVLDGRFIPGMGNSRPGQSKVSGNLDRRAQKSAHQYSGNINGSDGNKTIGCKELHSNSLVRQCSSNQRSSKTRLSLAGPTSCSKENSGRNNHQEPPTPPQTYRGEVERGCGRSIAHPHNRSRVATFTSDVQRYSRVSHSRPRGRSLCLPAEPSFTEICVPLQPPKSLGGGRSNDRLERIPSNLSVSSPRSSVDRSQEATLIRRGRDTSSQRPSENLPSSSSTLPSEGSSTPGAATPIRSRQELFFASRIKELSRLEFLRLAYSSLYSKEVVEDLLKAAADSSLKQYESNWRTFTKWLPASTRTIDRSLVMSYLVHISKTLAPRTVLVHRNALKAPLELAFGIDFNHNHFSLLAKSHFRRAPPAKKIIPVWSLEEALESLKSKEISKDNILLKTLFLIAVSSANRASE